MALSSMVGALATKRSAKKASNRIPHTVASRSTVDRFHRKVRNMAITFHFFPGERLHERMLAKELGVNRSLLHEALNRLSAEGFLTLSGNQGFFRKPLDAKEMFDLYELREQIEIAAVRLAVERVTEEQLLKLELFSQKTAENNARRSMEQVTSLDEEFHERSITLGGNIWGFNHLMQAKPAQCLKSSSNRDGN